MADKRNHTQERRVEAKWCQERTADARRTSAARRGDKDLVAYGMRLSDGNKGGKRPALKEESRRHTARCLQARLAVALRRSNVEGAVSAVGAWRLGNKARSSDDDNGGKGSVRQGDGRRRNTSRSP